MILGEGNIYGKRRIVAVCRWGREALRGLAVTWPRHEGRARRRWSISSVTFPAGRGGAPYLRSPADKIRDVTGSPCPILTRIQAFRFSSALPGVRRSPCRTTGRHLRTLVGGKRKEGRKENSGWNLCVKIRRLSYDFFIRSYLVRTRKDRVLKEG